MTYSVAHIAGTQEKEGADTIFIIGKHEIVEKQIQHLASTLDRVVSVTYIIEGKGSLEEARHEFVLNFGHFNNFEYQTMQLDHDLFGIQLAYYKVKKKLFENPKEYTENDEMKFLVLQKELNITECMSCDGTGTVMLNNGFNGYGDCKRCSGLGEKYGHKRQLKKALIELHKEYFTLIG